ncbi:hypothetical protein F0U61_27045 [Archangium violaceum]|uniref:hypothetical protein n=1 Tax=Archangium violaceum TaxID=83451 RepID=UPI002B3230AD|nr:hypothetical protein F0U61_27045 [Archangium violaceum]
MKRLVTCLALLTACTTTTRQAEPPAAAPAPQATAPTPPSSVFTFGGVEIFGSRKVPKEKLLELMVLPAPGTPVDTSKDEFIQQLMESKKRLTSTYSFAYSKASVVQWAPTQTLRVTVDLVDTGDEWRMAFSPEPQGNAPDPEGLMAAWKDWLKKLWKLRSEGVLPGETGPCRAPIGCYGRFDHPELAPLEQRFIEGVPRNVDALVRVMREDRDARRRETAVMLLGYMTSREEFVRAVLPSVRDSDQGVRNEALRLLGAAQKDQKRVIIPLESVLEALWFPSATDRNKAGWALVRIVETEGTVHRQQILNKAGEVLLEMAGAQQEIDHQPARKVLALLSGQDFGDDVAAWRRWVKPPH